MSSEVAGTGTDRLETRSGGRELAEKVNRKSRHLGLEPIYGLENAYGYGRSLAVWLIERGYVVKDINPALAYNQRKSAPCFAKMMSMMRIVWQRF
ncbi:hypothetical protein LAD12857_38920 [Lacrimispora amygdalina]|uniref:Transposase n=1 Tax=Lacrimispora amygdalina TaxID=253257 RepID=A0ABQ5MAW4_9FIRM